MSLLRYHLDEDCQSAALAAALRQHGIEVVTTNEAGIVWEWTTTRNWSTPRSKARRS